MTRHTGAARRRRSGAATSALIWLFRDRTTDRMVIAQWPNIPLALWILATVLARFTHGHVTTALTVVGTIALVVWAGDEILRGVNPWRRILGTVVLAGVIVGLAMSA